jgi:hypothetical protein
MKPCFIASYNNSEDERDGLPAQHEKGPDIACIHKDFSLLRKDKGRPEDNCDWQLVTREDQRITVIGS